MYIQTTNNGGETKKKNERFQQRKPCRAAFSKRKSSTNGERQLMMCLCSLSFTFTSQRYNQPCIQVIDTDCDQDLIRPISHSLTCSKLAESLLMQTKGFFKRLNLHFSLCGSYICTLKLYFTKYSALRSINMYGILFKMVSLVYPHP